MSDSQYAIVRSCAQELANSKGENTVVLDVREMIDWTDYFIITTATSSVHLKGLLRISEEITAAHGAHCARKPSLDEDNEWYLIDYGNFVVHIMSAAAREFYDIEALWYKAKTEKVEPSAL